MPPHHRGHDPTLLGDIASDRTLEPSQPRRVPYIYKDLAHASFQGLNFFRKPPSKMGPF